MRNVWMILLIGTLLASAGCEGPSPARISVLTSKVGMTCTVQFRRGDGLGTAAEQPIDPTVNGINNSMVSVVGKLTEASDEWIGLTTRQGTYCIPRSSILLLHFDVQNGQP